MLVLNEFDDFESGFETGGRRGVLVAENVSKSVECELAYRGEFVQEGLCTLLTRSEERAGERRGSASPETDGAAMNAAFAGRLRCR